MVRDQLDLAASAFDGGLDPAAFHCSPSREEALARLEWLLTERQRFGLVIAEPGLGKSHLAAAAARRLGGLGAESAVLSLRGLPEREWLDLLLARLPLDPASRAETTRPWLALENRLRENTLMERPTLLIFDDLHLAPTDAIDGVARLVAAGEPRFASVCVVATATTGGLSAIPDCIRQRSAVRIDLPPWTTSDVAAAVAFALDRVGAPVDCFSPAAIETLARFAAGVPHTAIRLARLAAVAASGEGLDRIEAATVERAWRELVPEEDLPQRSLAGDAGPDEPASASIRPVRQLFG
jgi:type II secretory pathway predicted ATPase ExeA